MEAAATVVFPWKDSKSNVLLGKMAATPSCIKFCVSAWYPGSARWTLCKGSCSAPRGRVSPPRGRSSSRSAPSWGSALLSPPFAGCTPSSSARRSTSRSSARGVLSRSLPRPHPLQRCTDRHQSIICQPAPGETARGSIAAASQLRVAAAQGFGVASAPSVHSIMGPDCAEP